MISIDTEPLVLLDIKVNVTMEDLLQKVKTSVGSTGMRSEATLALSRVDGCWTLKAVCQWFGFDCCDGGKGRVSQNSRVLMEFDFNDSLRFLKPASHVLVAAYTIGSQLEKEAANVSGRGICCRHT